MPKREDIRVGPGDRLRADHHRPGLRVRLLRHPGLPGAQAEEGIRVILVNSNPATIMTDPEFADATYVEPITPEFVEKVIAKERPDALLATLGGQTALNAAMALDEAGVLEKYGVELIGASHRGDRPRREPPAVQEDRRGARRRVARSVICHTMDDCLGAADELGYPMVVRPVVHDGRHRLRHGLRRGRPAPHRRRRPRRQPDHRGAPRGVDHRLEGVRARGDARHAPTTS